ncbi:MAG: FtsX-like permease family protein [Oligoflexia bacterium]|nr:FtsX-like permease family protein [Oligoflexia bacterium]
MLGLLKLGVRNISRHPGKNFLIGLVIFFANIFFFLAASITEETISSWHDYFSNTFLGHYNLTSYNDYEKDYTFSSLSFPKYGIDKEVLNYLDKEKISYLPRIKIGAAIFNDRTSTFEGTLVTLIGIKWQQELQRLKNLKIISNANTREAGTETGVFVWIDLAKKLKWKEGDSITLYIKDKTSGTYPYTYKIKGIVSQHKSAKNEGKGSINAFPLIFADYDILSKELGIENEIYEISITQKKLTPSQISTLKSFAKKKGLTLFSAEKGFGALYGIVDFNNFMGKILKSLILIILVVSVFNINMIGIFDRQKEFGTIIAIGAPKWWILSLIFLEQIIFATFIFIFSFLVFYIFVSNNFTIYTQNFAVLFAGNNINIKLVPFSLLESYFAIILALLISTIYPAYLATRINPVEIFREANI